MTDRPPVNVEIPQQNTAIISETDIEGSNEEEWKTVISKTNRHGKRQEKTYANIAGISRQNFGEGRKTRADPNGARNK